MRDCTEDGLPELLPLMDRVAEASVTLASPVRFALAQTDAERELAYRLRYEVVVARGWKRAEAMPDGLERDAHDTHATHILGWHGDTLAATARIIWPRPGVRLPTEEAFDVIAEPPGFFADCGRSVVAALYTDIQHRLFGGLLGRCWLEVRARGMCGVCGDLSPAMIRIYRRLGMNVGYLGPSQVFWGEERYPIYFDVPGSADSLLARWG